jgi:hypothetical protein
MWCTLNIILLFISYISFTRLFPNYSDECFLTNNVTVLTKPRDETGEIILYTYIHIHSLQIFILHVLFRSIKESLFTWLFYCNRQGHRDFLISLYITYDTTWNLQNIAHYYLLLWLSVRVISQLWTTVGKIVLHETPP